MSDKVLFSISGIFNTPDEIIAAAKKTAKKGFKKFDVNTPYPVHGMDNAMGLPPSKLGYVALVIGLTAAITGLTLMWWTAQIDYQNVFGGKPFFAFPAYVPITFEVMVLSASLATVISLIVAMFKFPNLSHPLHDTNYMKKVSSDKYGLYIEAEDPMFNEEEVKAFLTEIGAVDIEPIYYDDEEFSVIHNVTDPKFIMILVTVAIMVSGGTYFALNKLMFMPPFNWMMYQEKTIVQEKAAFFADGFGMRMPVTGTVARGNLPELIDKDPEKGSAKLVNPLLPSPEVFAMGQKKYDIYCSPCHGYHGEGDSRLNGQFPNPPSMHSEKARNWNDGRIYHIITKGQNVMPSYAKQLTPDERWAVVLYVRALQRSLNAKESDLNE
ncbi:MAG: quinol:electron acceptor oxidoreductase subunit ActD [Rhodothermaceae bacterium]